MGSGFTVSNVDDRKQSSLPHEAAYSELAEGSLINHEARLASLRRWGVVVYLIVLLMNTDPRSIVVTQEAFAFIIGLLIIIQPIFWWLEHRYPGYQSHKFRVWRFIYYLISSSAMLYIGKGTSAFLVLFLPYLILAGVYVGTLW